MKVVVVGGTGFIGSRIIEQLQASGHGAVAASPKTGVDTLTGAGVMSALDGADVVVDSSNAPPPANPEIFFEKSTRTLVAAAGQLQLRHFVVVSIVGIDRLGGTPYFRGKLMQERVVRESGLSFSIVRSTQFLEFFGAIADAATHDGVVRVPPVAVQPIAAKDAAAAVSRVALGSPINGVVEVAGPVRYRLDELIAETLAVANDHRRVVADADAGYFGAPVSEQSLVPV